MAPIRLLVCGGVHEGARLDLDREIVRIGSAAENDVVLVDCVFPHAITLHRDAPGAVAVEAVEGAIEIDGRVLAVGRRKRVKSACLLQAGGIALSLEIPAAARGDFGKKGLAGRFRLIALALLMGGGSVIVFATISDSGRAAKMTAKVVADIRHSGQLRVASGKPDHPMHIGELLPVLRRRTQQEGLQSIEIQKGDDGAVIASGWVLPDQMPAWRNVQRWFDTKAAGESVLVDQVHTLDAVPRLEIEAVWRGNPPHLIDGSGEQVSIGSTLANGWQLVAIESDAVLLQRNGVAIRVRYR